MKKTQATPRTSTKTNATFKAKPVRAASSEADAPWAFVVLPKTVSDTLPRRGRTSVDGSLNGHDFRATLEPDGQLGHWLRLDDALLDASGASIGKMASFEIAPMEEEPEPDIPADLKKALLASPAAKAVWDDTTTIARVDWIHWVTSAKQAKTRAQRVSGTCDRLASGKRRVCCFDPSGYYSKAFSPPKAAD